MSYDNTTLPPGWEAKFDLTNGKRYYINHNDKTTHWDHPHKNKKTSSVTQKSISKQSNGTSKHFSNVGVENIPLQHGSPDLRRNYVYPSHPSPIPAFQVSPHQSPKINILQDFSSKTRGSPLTVRSKLQESPLTNAVDTDEAVSKISAMFPTVSDAHIRLLMKKFHNREVLVISALQVEKNPITTPGPFATPPPQRNILQNGAHVPLHMTPPLGVQKAHSRGGSPILIGGSNANSVYAGSPRVGEGFRSTTRPHSSPKLKLRYMKSIFPQAEETIILDILYNNDNNIQRSSEKLREMGFEKKDSLKISQQKQQAKMKAETSKSPSPKSPVPIPKVKTADEKAKVKLQLQQDYKDTPEQLITMALESVDFDKEKANNLLKSIIDDLAKSEEVKIVETSEVDNKGTPNNKESTIPVSQSRQSLKSLLKSDKCDKEKSIFNRVIEESNLGHKSAYLSNTRGANPDLAKGKNDKLLLEDYINWHGPDPIIRKGPNQGLAKGPNLSYKQERTAACGPNANFHKGPNRSLVKGSIFQQMKAVVSVGGESRGK
ncbi:hypothetical protein HHI36_020611 [Cryptolaemus montrouzieri]|uniref:WW domain-containing protein n=1 Tax=Cryptolaemus montrouzieri TaxID=559131 RepID=A0ABD2NB70_9CUCU